MALPLMDLDDRTFTQLVREARKRIPVYAPDWTDHNAHDPGITLIELFAWLTEMQVYRLNRITDQSKWKFLQLMGIIQKEPDKNDEDKQKKKPGDQVEYPKNVHIIESADEVEKLEQGILKAREKLRTIYRAVTASDYETLALQTPGNVVARAKAIPRYHPKSHQEVPGIVTVIIIPGDYQPRQEPDEDLLKKVYQHLDQGRLLTTELFVIFPDCLEVSVKAEIKIKPQYEKTVKTQVEKGLNDFLHPVKGGPDGTGWPFGRTVYRSEVYQVIDGVEGVDYVTGIMLKKQGEIFKEEDIIIPKHSLVFPGEHQIGIEGENQE